MLWSLRILKGVCIIYTEDQETQKLQKDFISQFAWLNTQSSKWRAALKCLYNQSSQLGKYRINAYQSVHPIIDQLIRGMSLGHIFFPLCFVFSYFKHLG